MKYQRTCERLEGALDGQRKESGLSSACHRYGYTCGFHAGLGAGMGTGTRLPTRQKPIPVPIPVMVMHVA
jgi:hypothetical protein